jgi:hypothetical protein
MARVPYDQGLPFAEPAAAPPRDSYDIQANPGQFGGLLAQGAENAGSGLLSLSKFYDQTAAQQAVNNYQDQANEVLKSFKSLRGQDAMNAQDGTLTRLKELGEDGTKSLATPAAQLEFQQNVRYLRSRFEAEVGSHYDQQSQNWHVDVQRSAADNALKDVESAAVSGRSADVDAATQALLKARIREAQVVYGNTLGPDIALSVARKAQGDAITQQVQALAPRDPVKAAAVLDQNKDKLPGAVYDALSQRVKGHADAADIAAFVNGSPTPGGGVAPAPANPGSAAPPAPGETPTSAPTGPIAATPAVSTSVAPVTVDQIDQAIHGQESGGAATAATSVNGAVGGHQIIPETFARYARPGESITDPVANAAVGKRIIADYASRPGWGPDRVAVGYFSGESNVAPPGSPTPYLENRVDGLGKSTAGYVSDVMHRLGQPVPDAVAQAAGQPQTAFGMEAAMYARKQAEAQARWPNDIGMQQRAMQAVREDWSFKNALEAKDELARAKARRDAEESAANSLVITLLRNPAAFDPLTIANNPSLSSEQRITLNSAAQREQDRVRLGRDAGPYGAGFTDLYIRITAPEGTGGRITDPRQLWPEMASGHLTPAGYEKLNQVFEGKKTPDGQIEEETRKSFISDMRKMITRTDETMHIKDGKGDQLFTAALPVLLQAWQRARHPTDGKPPIPVEQLVDPKNANYLGRIAQPYILDAAHRTYDDMNVAPPERGPIPGAPSLDQLFPKGQD